MTKNYARLAQVVPLDRAGAGDLIGFNKRGQALYLPGGGSVSIAVGPDDDDADLGGDDGDVDDDDDDMGVDPPAPKVSTQKLLEENAKLQAAVKRNNSELKQRRLLGQYMQKHGITDLDAWLAGLGVDPETGKPTAGTAGPAGPQQNAPTPTPAQPESASQPADTTSSVEAEITRRLELEMAKRSEADKAKSEAAEKKAERLQQTLRDQAMRLALREAGFTGDYKRAKRVLDIDALQVVESGEDGFSVEGAIKAVESLREEIPEWFRPKRPAGATRSGGADVDGPDRRPPAPAPKRWDQAISDQIAGRR